MSWITMMWIRAQEKGLPTIGSKVGHGFQTRALFGHGRPTFVWLQSLCHVFDSFLLCSFYSIHLIELEHSKVDYLKNRIILLFFLKSDHASILPVKSHWTINISIFLGSPSPLDWLIFFFRSSLNSPCSIASTQDLGIIFGKLFWFHLGEEAQGFLRDPSSAFI